MKWASLIVLFLSLACRDYPRDPMHSWEEARSSGLEVGLVRLGEGSKESLRNLLETEKQLVEGFARAHSLEVHWQEGTESELVDQLSDYRLHLVCGGFSKRTIWREKAGQVKSYDREHGLLIAPGENRLLYQLEAYIQQTRFR